MAVPVVSAVRAAAVPVVVSAAPVVLRLMVVLRARREPRVLIPPVPGVALVVLVVSGLMLRA
jgi:hypothetical protein